MDAGQQELSVEAVGRLQAFHRAMLHPEAMSGAQRLCSHSYCLLRYIRRHVYLTSRSVVIQAVVRSIIEM